MTRRQFVVAATVFAALLGVGCGSEDDPPAAQPVPGATTFEPGRFDDLPQYPRSEPLGPRSEEKGVVARSFKVSGGSPEQVLDFYVDALEEPWRLVTGVEKLGAGTFRADWVSEDYLFRVSATREPELDSTDDASETFVTQYSLTLHPL
ncbi:MAG: hypothetical protein ACRD1D_06370 [Acidimicrobiales bacterium]